MRSVRLEPELDARLEEAARITGQPVSEIIRKAVRRRCDELLGDRLDHRLAGLIGSVAAGGSSRKTGRDFAKLLETQLDDQKKKRKTRSASSHARKRK